MSKASFPAPCAAPLNHYKPLLWDAGLALADERADALGVPVAYVYADSAPLAEAIVMFGLLTPLQRQAVLREMKARSGYDTGVADGKRPRRRAAKATRAG